VARSRRFTTTAATTAHAAATVNPVASASVNALAAASARRAPSVAGSDAATAFACPIESSAAMRGAAGSDATSSSIRDP
jgi:hypothetical protein